MSHHLVLKDGMELLEFTPKGWSGLLGLLCVKLQPNVDFSLFRKE